MSFDILTNVVVFTKADFLHVINHAELGTHFCTYNVMSVVLQLYLLAIVVIVSDIDTRCISIKKIYRSTVLLKFNCIFGYKQQCIICAN